MSDRPRGRVPIEQRERLFVQVKLLKGTSALRIRFEVTPGNRHLEIRLVENSLAFSAAARLGRVAKDYRRQPCVVPAFHPAREDLDPEPKWATLGHRQFLCDHSS